MKNWNINHLLIILSLLLQYKTVLSANAFGKTIKIPCLLDEDCDS